MVPELIKLFKLVAVSPDTALLDPVGVNEYAMKCGYLVHPKACTLDVMLFLKTQEVNLNSTFYKNWGTVEKLSEFEMHILQIMHYMSTYGTDFSGPTFTMNDVPQEMQFSNFTLLMPCTDQELFDRIYSFLKSGIALSAETLKLLVEQLSSYFKKFGWEVDIDDVTNREAVALLCSLYGKLPRKPINLFRYLYYLATGSSLVIKNKDTFRKISKSYNTEALKLLLQLSEEQKQSLATLFYRYKPIFLAIRKKAQNYKMQEAVSVVNEIRRLARTYHKPFTPGVLESLLGPSHSREEVDRAIDKETNTFKLVKLYNYLSGIEYNAPLAVYIIRNGKVFVKASPKHEGSINAAEIASIVKARICQLLSAKSLTPDGRALTVRFPENLELSAPISEKQFVGNVPYGSSYKLQKNNLIGIYWRNEWGTRDFDLWMIGENGERLGWAAEHKSEDVLFSGDMTNADPEATEIFYGKNTWPDCTIHVSRYNGDKGSKYRLFFASDEIKKLPLNYMVNPDSILFQEDMTSDKTEQVVGIIHDKKVYFSSINTGNSRLPLLGESMSYQKAYSERFSNFLKLKDILLESGFKEFDNETSEGMPLLPDIDLTNLSKDTIIALFKS